MDPDDRKKRQDELRDKINEKLLESLSGDTSQASKIRSTENTLADRLTSVKDGGSRPLARSRAEYNRQVKKIREATYDEAGLSDPLKGAKREGAYSDDELRKMGANKMGYDWSKTNDPLRGNRLEALKAAQATPQTNGAPVVSTETTSQNTPTSPSPKVPSSIAEELKSSRRDNLQSFIGARNKQTGTVTEITSGVDGQVLARRGEGASVVASGGAQGAMGGLEDKPGQMTLTKAGENSIRDRLTVNKTADGATVVTGRYGTAVGGKSALDQMKDQGLVAKNFQLTPEQKTGQAPLPKEFEEARTKFLADAGEKKRRLGGTVV